MNFFKTLVLAGAVTFAAGMASAASFYSYETCSTSDVTVGGGNADACYGKVGHDSPAGINDTAALLNPGNIFHAAANWMGGSTTGMFHNDEYGYDSWSFLAKSEGGAESDGLSYDFRGNFTWTGAIYEQMLVVLKEGNTFAAYLFVGGIGEGGTWDDVAFHDNGDALSLSHMTVYARGAMSEVPLPAAGFLLIGAMGGLAAFRRKS